MRIAKKGILPLKIVFRVSKIYLYIFSNTSSDLLLTTKHQPLNKNIGLTNAQPDVFIAFLQLRLFIFVEIILHREVVITYEL